MRRVDHPIIALMTDFGTEDFFVPSLKGVIAAINPLARVIDITHAIPSFDVLAGSFVLFASCRYFPPRTIFLSVVDPGVGSPRRIILVETQRYFFIAPDNGLICLALEEETIKQSREVTNPQFFLKQQGVTFEARDRMAPVSAWLSYGIAPEEFGPDIKDYKKLKVKSPGRLDDAIQGEVLYKDKFGNLITNIPIRMMEAAAAGDKGVVLDLEGRKTRSRWGLSYSSVEIGQPLMVNGSMGLVEIAVREGSAADVLGLSPGDRIVIRKGG